MSDTPDLQEMLQEILQEEAVKESRYSDLMWGVVAIVAVMAASLVFVTITVARKTGNANNNPVRCDCRCHLRSDQRCGECKPILDSRADTDEVRR